MRLCCRADTLPKPIRKRQRPRLKGNDGQMSMRLRLHLAARTDAVESTEGVQALDRAAPEDPDGEPARATDRAPPADE